MTLAAPQSAPASAVFDAGRWPDLVELLSRRPADLMMYTPSAAPETNQPRAFNVQVSPPKPAALVGLIQQKSSFEETLFNNLVSLKVATSLYAMHLSAEERARLFARLDSVINTEDWHEDDSLPRSESFVNFLKWMVYSNDFSWSSIGVSNEGNVLVAWSRPDLVLTAQFFVQNKVTWTSTVETKEGPAHTVGTCSLQYFATQALFYLSRGAMR
jgi:hypothetical protein